MSEMYLGRVAYVSVGPSILAAARPVAWATGVDTVCLNVETGLSNLEPETLAEQRLWHLLEQADCLEAGDLILDEVKP